jgi:hypothetical protein
MTIHDENPLIIKSVISGHFHESTSLDTIVKPISATVAWQVLPQARWQENYKVLQNIKEDTI